MFKKSLFIIILFALLGFQSELPPIIPAPLNQGNSFFTDSSDSVNYAPIAVVGDLQRTSLWEILMGREQNDSERVKIVKSIAKSKPGVVILLGDMVFEGDNYDHWKYFDKLIKPIKKEHIPIYAVLGNHEYWGHDYRAMQNVSARIPQLRKKHWYTEIYHGVAMLFLDSNDDEYTEEDWEKQKNWYEHQLNKLDADPSIKGIFVFMHHPPYTNSLVTGDEIQVQLTFVPAFVKSKKTMALVSGHAHTYERFIKEGKTFIVSGGGGGPRVLLKEGGEFHHDLYHGSNPRPFNYLLLNIKRDGVDITVKGLSKGKSKIFTMEEFLLPFNASF